jgi:hypothetical protein
MEALQEWGIEVIKEIQICVDCPIETFFEAITFTGDQQFYLLLVPLLIWCVDFHHGARLGLLYLASGVLNTAAKEVLMQPRPCVFDEDLCISEWYGYGLPSGHSQTAVVFWGMIANWSKKTWVWIAAVAMMILMGLSRVYLGVHFPTDVFGGWGMGIAILLLYFGFGRQVENWLRGLSIAAQIALAIILALVFVALWPVDDMVAAIATITGVGVGLALAARYVTFNAKGPLWERVRRYVVGVIVVAALFFGLRQIFPEAGESLYIPFRFVRYGLVGFWVSLGAPWLFEKIGIAGDPKESQAVA